ncbi:RHS repeat-associated core domain-containing protein [Macellibacteroides fermentans]|uniref:RHS repeat-associated core domain-containing protein n=1 Tax=Parabacteroides chartae TaxID=1037355 RepID=A0A1T5F2U8_9BACT|nr:RHS repeat-associated core domain-containing protein [Parabacteroides chartae]SKB90493.1 RHS repeat-associated core domain-containing protein [Parabacteroides chartae]
MEPALGRFTTLDPLAEKYYSVSPYVYCANNPVKFIDPDGREIRIYRSQVLNEEKATVIIEVTGKLVNKSSTEYTNEQLQSYAERLSSSISKIYTGEGENINFRAEVNITVATDQNGITESDHIFTLFNQGELPGSEGKSTIAGNAVKGEKRINISKHILDRKEETSGEYAETGKTENGLSTFERTAAHELGHSATLTHPKPNSLNRNLMHQAKVSNSGKIVTESQILQIEKAYLNKELNK